MGLGSLARKVARRVLERRDHRVVPSALLYDWQKAATAVSLRSSSSPSSAANTDPYLRTDNPRLLDLEQAYARVEGAVTRPTVWNAGHVQAMDLQRYRTDDVYLWQRRSRNMNELSYALTYYYLKTTDRLGLFERLGEDQAFCADLFEVVDGRLVSRDLLDSVTELNFLERHLAISQRQSLVVLDIGAGYGRLAYRSLTALPSIGRYLCTDAVPVSTFLCEHYLRYRGVDARAQVVPLHEIRGVLQHQPVDLAINIHSFSECTLEAVAWWTRLLREHGVPRLMVVPNEVGADGLSMLTTAGEDFSRLLAEQGYRLIARDPKYADPLVQKYGPFPAIHFLYELQPASA